MKKHLPLVALLLALCLCACTSKAAEGSSPAAPGEQSGQSRPAGQGGGTGGAGQHSQEESDAGESGVKLEVTRTVTGKVTSIVGNEVTLTVLSETAGGEKEVPGHGDADGSSSAQEPLEAASGAPVEAPAEEPASEPAESSQESQAEESEERTVVIPVGLSVGRSDFSSISAGMKLRLTYGLLPSDGSEVITSVSVLS